MSPLTSTPVWCLYHYDAQNLSLARSLPFPLWLSHSRSCQLAQSSHSGNLHAIFVYPHDPSLSVLQLHPFVSSFALSALSVCPFRASRNLPLCVLDRFVLTWVGTLNGLAVKPMSLRHTSSRLFAPPFSSAISSFKLPCLLSLRARLPAFRKVYSVSIVYASMTSQQRVNLDRASWDKATGRHCIFGLLKLLSDSWILRTVWRLQDVANLEYVDRIADTNRATVSNAIFTSE